MRSRLSALAERARASLFLVPLACIATGAAAAAGSLAVDRNLRARGTDLPWGLGATVDSSRAVLGTVASATIAFAGVAFSVSLLVIQLASSQHSPRIVPGLFRDTTTKRVMGIVVGTFTFALLVLRAVRSTEDAEAMVPSLSVLLAVVAGVASILAVVVFIDSSAHRMDVSRLLGDATDAACRTLATCWPEPDSASAGWVDTTVAPPDDAAWWDVRLGDDGWIQRIDTQRLVAAVPDGSWVRLEVEVGRYAVRGAVLCRVHPSPPEPLHAEATDRIRAAVLRGPSRTIEQDVGFGVRQLADVGLRALSPGVNDPTTAQDAIFHLASVLAEALARTPPPPCTTIGGRVLERSHAIGIDDLIELAFDEIRLVARGQPTVCRYLLEALELLDDVAAHRGRSSARSTIATQAARIRDDAARSDLGPDDVAAIEHAYDQRFGSA